MTKVIGGLVCIVILAFAFSTWKQLAPDTQGTILSAWSELARIVAHFVDSLFA